LKNKEKAHPVKGMRFFYDGEIRRDQSLKPDKVRQNRKSPVPCGTTAPEKAKQCKAVKTFRVIKF